MTANMALLTLASGLLGNVVSFMVFLAPIPTFYKVYKKKSTEGFQSAPYVVGLFSCMLLIYYALLKTNVMLLITINAVGCLIETFYICFFLFYASKKTRRASLKLIVLLIFVGFGVIVALTQFLASGAKRTMIVGWICLVFSICVFVAPMGVVRQVIKTKSVEYMPILLSMALTLSAVMWFCYGLLLRDFIIAVPNVLGFIFGVVQMILYFVYKNNKKISLFEVQISDIEEQKIKQLNDRKNIRNDLFCSTKKYLRTISLPAPSMGVFSVDQELAGASPLLVNNLRRLQFISTNCNNWPNLDAKNNNDGEDELNEDDENVHDDPDDVDYDVLPRYCHSNDFDSYHVMIVL